MLSLNPILAQLSEWIGVVAVGMLAGISPSFRRKPLVFLYPRREVIVSLSLFGLILAVSVVFAVFVHPVDTGGSTLPLGRLMLAVLSLIPFAAVLAIRRQPIRAIGWAQQTLRPSLLLGLALGLLALFLRGKVFPLLSGVSAQNGWSLLVWLGISLAEETIFRGFIQLRLVSVLGAPWRGILGTALLFTLWQFPIRLAMASSTNSLLLSLALVLGQGLIAGYIMHKSGNVAAPAFYQAISGWAQSLS